MIIKHLPAIFEPARPVLQRIEDAGYEAYFVGGCVRDTILGDPIHDIDIATSAYPSEIKAIFNRTVDTGIEHGTVMILDHGTGYETTTFRTESGYQDFRRPDNVTFVRSLSEDLKRRDFTINALALKENGEVIDLFNGLDDLKKHLIKAVGDPNERFHEDALRMMRAVRFASKLDFVIAAETLAGIKQNAELLAKIAVERIRVEFEKLLMGQNPVTGLSDFLRTGLYRYCPGLANQHDSLSGLLLLNNWQIQNAEQAWAVIVTQLGLNAQETSNFLRQWKTSNELITNVKRMLPVIQELKTQELSSLSLFNAGEKAVQDANQVAKLYGWSIPDEQLKEQYNALPIKSGKELAVNGGTLIKEAGIKPGPLLGKLLNQLTVEVVNGNLANNKDDLITEVEKIKKEG
ncbi:CCA tRNA nucleotidyltransferase [Limosilactobacillus agrestimuris]|uniref:CCA tRNA nucleotidyltransferase n=1 Tax=Limosilactobacillus agrestimuris TaxID=2941331 RepID=UPI00203DE09F|nr:CCA tRNA nucleotidyltransferase [Limosilactobacillus agrestimuris]